MIHDHYDLISERLVTREMNIESEQELYEKVEKGKVYHIISAVWDGKKFLKSIATRPQKLMKLSKTWHMVTQEKEAYDRHQYIGKIISSKLFKIFLLYWQIRDRTKLFLKDPLSILSFRRVEEEDLVVSPPRLLPKSEIIGDTFFHQRNTLSAIMPVWYGHQYLESCIRSTLNNTLMLSELILIDNGADKTAKQVIAQYSDHPLVRVIKNSKNVGFPKAINQGFENAQGQYIALLNDDLYLPREWDKELIDCLCMADDIGIVGPMTSWSGFLPQLIEEARDVRFSMTHQQIEDYAVSIKQNKYSYQKVSHISGFCFVLEKQLVDNFGVFDESYSPGSGEEVDFCWRVAEHGVASAVCEWSYVHHYGHTSFSKRDDIDAQKIWKEHEAKVRRRWGR